MEELKACPFCGGKAEIVDHGGFFTVGCTNLDCAATIDLLEPSNESAAADWNRRAAPENKPLTLEELRERNEKKQPVWMVEKGQHPDYEGWWQFSYEEDGVMEFFTFGNECEEVFATENYGKTWLAYARKPEGSSDV